MALLSAQDQEDGTIQSEQQLRFHLFAPKASPVIPKNPTLAMTSACPAHLGLTALLRPSTWWRRRGSRRPVWQPDPRPKKCRRRKCSPSGAAPRLTGSSWHSPRGTGTSDCQPILHIPLRESCL